MQRVMRPQKGRVKKMKVKLNHSAIKIVLLHRDVSQNALAKSIGISSAYFSQIGRGVRYPSAEVQRRILDALAPMTFDEIFVIEGSDVHQEDPGGHPEKEG